MLPPKILARVCDYLDPQDIICLSAVNASINNTLLRLRKLCLKKPYFRLDYSQWDSWQASLSDFEADSLQLDPFKHVELPKYVDKPLPADFRALQGNVERRLLKWNFCDVGLVFGEEVLNLKEDTNTDRAPYLKPYSPYPFCPVSHYEPSHCYASAREEMRTETCMATIALTNDGREGLNSYYSNEDDVFRLLVQYSDGTCLKHMLEPLEECYPYHGSFLILAADDVTIYARFYGSTFDTYFLPKGRQPVLLQQSPRFDSPQGLLFYDGHLFLVYFSEDRELQVLQLQSDMREKQRNVLKLYIYQDARYPRYGLAYHYQDFLVYVIDLQTRKVHYVVERDMVTVVGVSNGELGMWTYTTGYLLERCREQKLVDMSNLVGELSVVFQERERSYRERW